ncbi:MAG: amino acid racemase [Mogibacterium sp.]|nr:amino acid racemase [Mogibacterium sp.]
MKEKLIGVIGGMGPMASQLFYRMVTEMTDAKTDQEHLRMLILSDTGMPDRTEAILSGEHGAVSSRLLEDAKLLERCGCDAIAVTCNTAHFFIDQIADALTVPVIHMIRETLTVLQEENRDRTKPLRAAVLATDGTIRAGLYQKELEYAGIEPYLPSEAAQRKIMSQIYDRVKAGLPWERSSWMEIEQELREAGCDRALLACTELSLIGYDNHLPDLYLDPMQVLAQRVITFAGHRIRQSQEEA